MSEYIYNTVTSYGAALIAQATAANPIVIVGAMSRATAASGGQELATAPASWYDGRTGDIATVSATGNVARIVAVFRNAGASRQAAKSIAVTARLASQTDADAVVLAAISDPASTIELPAEADTGQAVEFPINIAVNPGGTVTVTPGASASVADLDRFVSLHAPGQPTTGEAQTVRGTKTFNDGILGTSATFNTVSATVYGGVNIGNSGDYRFENIYSNDINIDTVSAKDNANVTLSANLLPANGLTVSIGSQGRKFNDINALQLNGVIPTPTKGSTPGTDNAAIPVGSICLITIAKSDNSNFTTFTKVYCGEEISSSGGTLIDNETYDKCYVTSFRYTSSDNGLLRFTFDTATPLSSGMKFKAICGCDINGGYPMITILAIRIE